MTASSLASLSGHGVAHTAHALVAIRWRGCAATSKAKRLGVSPSAPRASLESAAPSAPTAPNLSNGADDEHARMSVAAVDMRLLALPTEGGDPQAADARSARASAARSANSLGAHTRAGELPTLDHWFDTVALPDHPMASQQPSTDAHLARVVHSAHLAVAVLRREKLDVLNSCDVFVGPQARAWPPRVLDAIADESELVPIERYKPVYRFGSPAECVFIIADGAVAVHPLLAKPHALRAGALFGESALLSALSRAQPAHSVSKADAERLPVHWRPDTVECIESGRALRVPAHALRKVPVRRLSLTGELETAARALASVAVARWRASMVQSLSLFHGATQRVAAATADLFQVRLLRSGEYVFSKGQAGTLFFLIVAGAIAIEVPLEDGSIRHVRLIRHTDTSPFFGELALFSPGKPRSASACASEPSILLSMGAESLDRLVLLHPTITEHFRELRRLVYGATAMPGAHAAAQAGSSAERRGANATAAAPPAAPAAPAAPASPAPHRQRSRPPRCSATDSDMPASESEETTFVPSRAPQLPPGEAPTTPSPRAVLGLRAHAPAERTPLSPALARQATSAADTGDRVSPVGLEHTPLHARLTKGRMAVALRAVVCFIRIPQLIDSRRERARQAAMRAQVIAHAHNPPSTPPSLRRAAGPATVDVAHVRVVYVAPQLPQLRRAQRAESERPASAGGHIRASSPARTGSPPAKHASPRPSAIVRAHSPALAKAQRSSNEASQALVASLGKEALQSHAGWKLFNRTHALEARWAEALASADAE